jgi:hypothetical protein
VRNNSAPPKWSKLWTDAPKAGDRIGAYTPEQLEQMNHGRRGARISLGRREFLRGVADLRREAAAFSNTGGGSESFLTLRVKQAKLDGL